MKISVKVLSLVAGAISILGLLSAAKYTPGASKKPAKLTSPAGEVSTELVAHNRNALFDASAYYTFTVKNATDTDQVGTVSYLVSSQKGAKLFTQTVKAHIKKNSSENYDFRIPALKTGFYKVNFMVNVSDYDDTTRRVFGVTPENIISEYKRPDDFDAFWQKAKEDLAKVKPDFKITEQKKMNKDGRKVYLVEMKSLDNVTVRGWLTVPETDNKHKKFAVLMELPGYQVDLDPVYGSDESVAIFSLNVRGQGNSRDQVNTSRDDYILYNIDDKNKYVLRGALMDCVRAIDFVYTQPNLRKDNIIVSGGSLGGWLALGVASLDTRVDLCSSMNPILSDVHNLVGEVEWPITDLHRFEKANPKTTFEQLLSNLDYFDAKNFAPNVRCNTLMGIGLLDPLVPPNNEYAAYNLIPASKKIKIFKDLGHEVGQVHKDYEGKWMRDTFGLF